MRAAKLSALQALLLIASLFMPTALYAQTPASQPSAAAVEAIPFAFTHQIEAGDDTPEGVIAKAATVLPRPNQTDWMRLERTFFIHFGPNTFRGVEWAMVTKIPQSSIRPSSMRTSG